MNNTNAVTISGRGTISAFIAGKCYTVETDHKNYSKILDAVKASDWDSFIDLVDLEKKVKSFIEGDITINDGVFKYKGLVIRNYLTERIMQFMVDGLPFKPLLRFLENLLENPSKRAVDELYTFLEVGGNPITEDGCFLAFKNVRSDFKDIHSGTFDNSVGATCTMPRNQVCDDKDRTCSSGLHFCSIAYLPSFSDSNGGKTVILKINPKNVVSIPSDYNNTKGRCCEYTVIAEYTENWREKIAKDNQDNGFDHDLYDDFGNAYGDPDYGIKPSGQKYYNVRDESGKFVSK